MKDYFYPVDFCRFVDYSMNLFYYSTVIMEAQFGPILWIMGHNLFGLHELI